MNTWEDTKKTIRCDIYRNLESLRKSDYIKALFGKSTVSLLLYFRICHYFANLNKKNTIQFLLHSICYLRFGTLKNKCGIELNQRTQIGYGLRLPHKGNIVIHPLAVIGNNCEIMQGVTIGNNFIKDRDAVARIGNEVTLCAGSKIIGHVTIGNNVIVGANAVVTHDCADNTIMGGVPARVIGSNTRHYIINEISF